MKYDAESKFRKPVAQFYILDARGPELAIKDAVFSEKRSLARTAAGPEVGEIEDLPVLETVVGKKETAGLRDVTPQRCNWQRRCPSRISQDRYVLLWMLLMSLHVFFEQTRVGDIVIIEKKQNSAA